MKYSLITLTLLTSFAFADFVNPLPQTAKALDNGGIKNSIDAYNDGIGVAVVDNKYATELNKQHLLKDLVFKYGEKAKISGSSVVDYVSIAPESTTKEKEIAQLFKTNQPIVQTEPTVSFLDLNNYLYLPYTTSTYKLTNGYYSTSTTSIGIIYFELTQTTGKAEIEYELTLTGTNKAGGMVSIANAPTRYLTLAKHWQAVNSNGNGTDIAGDANIPTGAGVFKLYLDFDNKTMTLNSIAYPFPSPRADGKLFFAYTDASSFSSSSLKINSYKIIK